jgi:hypothetical protein
VPSDERAPGVGRGQRREQANSRRLARTVRSEEAADGAAGHLEVDAVERKLVAVALDETLRFDRILDGHTGHTLPRARSGAAN